MLIFSSEPANAAPNNMVLSNCQPHPFPARVRNAFAQSLQIALWPILLAGTILHAAAGEKRILLRNKTIVTARLDRQSLRAQAGEIPVSGLYLLQFSGPAPADLREQLAARGVNLLRPVPEEAFVAELTDAKLNEIRALPFVHWAGPYRPEHKTHFLVQQIAQIADDRQIAVTALLSSTATARETAILQRVFRLLTRYAKSSSGRLLQGQIAARDVHLLAQSKAVLWIEPAPEPKLVDAVAAQIVGGEGEEMLPAVYELGYDGEGVTVAVADSGLHLGEGEEMHVDLAGRVDGFFYYGELLDASDEHSHGTHVTGIIAGDGSSGETDENGFLYGLGVAPRARIVAQRIFDGAGGYQAPPSYGKLTADAVRAGAVIGSNSWGDETQGRYDISAMEFDALVRDADPETPGDQPYILEFSAGNAGPGERTIYSPAVGKNVIATGASQNNRFDFFIYASGQESMADFSSRGPCEDGRIKPDIVAPGTWIASLQSAGATDENAWAPISPLYQYQGGTSQAGPHASGAAALFVQQYRERNAGATPSPALVKAALINSAVDMDNTVGILDGGTSYVPNMDEGWGRVDMWELLSGDRSFDYTDQTSLLQAGQTFEKRLVLASGDLPLKVTLTYTDVPGFPPAIPALVNDLDLEVISPSGTIYRGNQFIQGQSVPNAPGTDAINNVENVTVELPERGEYIVRVIARRVIEDARRDTITIDQDFAMVFSGDVPAPGEGVISLDRRAYSVPGLVQLKLIDFDLAGQAQALVLLTSTTQPNGLPLQLNASGPGVFTGQVATAIGPVANDGRLHVQHGDQIEVRYQDVSPSDLVTAQARADLVPPVVTNLLATNRFGKELISWNTDEIATGVVYYRTNGAAFQAVTNHIPSLRHEVIIDALFESRTYFYYIVSTDEAGNTITNDNNGAFYSFVARPAATVLLVDAYTHTPDSEAPEIPVTEYTVPLDRTGISYEVWNVSSNGSPTVSDLSPFRVVMWRINDSFWDVGNTISPAQQSVITEYLSGGGSFFLSSMDILTRLGPIAFRSNVLQVAEFKQRTSALDECPDCDEDYGAAEIEGAPFEGLTAGMLVPLDYSNYPVFELEPILPNIGPDLSDIFVPGTNAAPILLQEDGGVVGIKSPRAGQDNSGRVVFLSFPLDAVPLDGPAPNNRATLLRNVLAFLAPGLNGLGTISLDNTSYTVPSRVTIEVADSDLAEQQSVSVTCRVVNGGASVTAELKPTVRPGLFRGFLTLVTTNEPAAPERLPIGDGDELNVEYMDQSANASVQAGAAIDVDLPEISNRQLEADYESALITWETDEETDALVQFGESTFLGKTAYHPGPNSAHSLLLSPLVPDRIYYYQVVSRDAAGNTVVDNNDGKLYTFRTLKPLFPPWSDDLESGATDWSVQDGEESVGRWTLGKPNNALDTAAHSPDHAWGSNLNGESTDYTSSFLVSPAIDLTGGNHATLKFWHNYDFLGDATFELGRLLLFTNTQTQPLTLDNYEEFTMGWEEMEYDLTPYIGRVVHLVWAYEMLDFSFEGTVHPGWLVDDVQVTITNLARGTLQITNNIADATFVLTGPTSFEGSGRWLVRSNALAGKYVINFSPVPYFETPPPETNLLAADSVLTFNGRYTFADVNQNGLPDGWEMEKFNEVSPSRSADMDTDGDGLSDGAEFAAGTEPAQAESRLQVFSAEILSNNRIRLNWPSTPGKTYQILGSRDGTSWEKYSAPVRASSESTQFVVPAPQGRFYFFKLQLQN